VEERVLLVQVVPGAIVQIPAVVPGMPVVEQRHAYADYLMLAERSSLAAFGLYAAPTKGDPNNRSCRTHVKDLHAQTENRFNSAARLCGYARSRML
jgi:hypothetical protein